MMVPLTEPNSLVDAALGTWTEPNSLVDATLGTWTEPDSLVDAALGTWTEAGWWCLCGCSGCTWLVVFCAGAVVWDVGGAGVVDRSKPNSRSVCLNPTADQCMNNVMQ